MQQIDPFCNDLSKNYKMFTENRNWYFWLRKNLVHKQMIYNMRYRHKTNPPRYLQDLELLEKRRKQVVEIFNAQLDILDKHINILKSYDPKPEKSESKKFAIKSQKTTLDFR